MSNEKTVRFKAGERIITKGDAADNAYMIKSGKVHVFLEKEGKIVTLADLVTGAIFGESALFGAESYGAHVKAEEDTDLIVITPESFQDKIDASDPMLKSIVEMLIARLRKTNEDLLKRETREFVEIDLI